MNYKTAIAAGLAAMTLSACNAPGPQSFHFDEKGTLHPTMIRSEFEMNEEVNASRSWNIAPPTRLDVIMEVWSPETVHVAAAELRCDDMGGTFVWYEVSDQWVCEGVDY